jgi:hypothetical protein
MDRLLPLIRTEKPPETLLSSTEPGPSGERASPLLSTTWKKGSTKPAAYGSLSATPFRPTLNSVLTEGFRSVLTFSVLSNSTCTHWRAHGPKSVSNRLGAIFAIQYSVCVFGTVAIGTILTVPETARTSIAVLNLGQHNAGLPGSLNKMNRTPSRWKEAAR